MSKSWLIVGPAVDTWMRREQGRVTVSFGGTQASLPPVHRIPFCQIAVRNRSSLVAIDAGIPGWSAFGGWDVAGMAGSTSFKARLPPSGVPVIDWIPKVGDPVLQPRVEQSLLL